ncbi:ABC transporter permease [Luteococcus peritonei]|uniref:Oligopeptide transport system permease protein OppC n=1 Tax=Luteococcus peritonei TaxID=88874 RepID=A0ABW4RSP6_9ACTN
MTNFEPEPGAKAEEKATPKAASEMAELEPQSTVVAADAEDAAAESDDQHISRGRLIAKRFWRPLGAKIGVAMLSVIILLALFGPYIGQWRYDDVDSEWFLSPPSNLHWFGTTQGGRDVFAMSMEGLRKSLIIGFSVAILQVLLASLIGASAAFFGGRVEKSILWLIDLMLVIPSFLLIAIISQNTGGDKGSTWLFILMLVAFSWMLSARVVRAMTLSVVNLDYVNAARFMNVPSWTTITKHVIPNISSYLIIDGTLAVAGAIISETALSYFGFGVQAPETSLGTLLSEGTQTATTFPWVFLAPAALLVLTLLSVNFIGDSLRDAIDPSSKSGGQA